MAKKPAKPKHEEPEFESQELPEDEPVTRVEDEGTPEAKGKAVSKADACRAALAEGITETADAVSFAKSRFGIDIKPTDFTLYKSKAKAKGGATAAKPGLKPRMAQLEKVVEEVKPAERGGIISDLAAVKALVDKLGVEEVVGIAKLFG